MEYSFYSQGLEQSIKLEEYSFVVTKGNTEYKINYAEVEGVRLRRPKSVKGKNIFSCKILITDKPSIIINSFNIVDNQIQGKFNHYNQFIRVLHFHLKNKSTASFRYGMSYGRLVFYSLSALLVLAVSYPLSIWLQEHLLSVYLVVPAVIAFSILKILTDKPGTYNPDGIPYEILPGTSNFS